MTGSVLGAHRLKHVGDVFQKDESEDDMLVFRRVYIVAEPIGCEPKLGLKAEIGGSVVGFRLRGHQVPSEEIRVSSRAEV
jgi:hypothetical protein